MSESEATDSTVVNYREGDTPVPLPGLAIIGVKLLGLYALIQSVPQLVYLPILIWQGVLGPGSDWVRLAYALPQVCYLVIGIVLLRKAEWVVARVARVPRDDVPAVTFSEYGQAVAFSLVGVLLITWGTAGLASQLVGFIMLQAQRGAGAVVGDFGLTGLARPLVEFAAGLYLFLRGRGLASLWHRMRYGGVRVREVE